MSEQARNARSRKVIRLPSSPEVPKTTGKEPDEMASMALGIVLWTTASVHKLPDQVVKTIMAAFNDTYRVLSGP